MERDLKKFQEERQRLVDAYNRLTQQREGVKQELLKVNGIIEYLEKKQGEDKVE